MIVVGVIGVDKVVTEHIFMFFMKNFGFKGIKLVNCEKKCNLDEKTVDKLESTTQFENDLLTSANNNNLVFKEVCFCGSETGESQEEWIKFRATKAFMIATSNLNSNYVISNLTKESELDIFSETLFVSLAVDMPLIYKFPMLLENQNIESNIKNEKTIDILNNNPEKLKELVSLLVQDLDEKKNGISKLLRRSDYYISYFKDFSDLETKLFNLGLSKIDSRPNWDEYFMKIAKIASQRSNCITRKVGSVIVKNKKIISTGYNGTPKNMKNCFEGGCTRCIDPNRVEGKSLEACSCMHAEANAMFFAGIEKCIGATIYVTLMPCLSCTKSIIQCEFERVVFIKDYAIPGNISTIKLLRNSNIKVDRFLEKQSFL
ncbi:DCMP deaminase [Cryptosporidium ubiquitum]|uniref:dCMP deaminase n=1 Tax=Cryptosporidium ubiquitum TaxID=857276 RepID=A0A1J4MC96_9CRYT|nr:DCMP deaminase [Cryptosporidium ubiquitum]OII71850.1 DCMP deaminase [Cryptosporidium ubiquitum]